KARNEGYGHRHPQLGRARAHQTAVAEGAALVRRVGVLSAAVAPAQVSAWLRAGGVEVEWPGLRGGDGPALQIGGEDGTTIGAWQILATVSAGSSRARRARLDGSANLRVRPDPREIHGADHQ